MGHMQRTEKDHRGPSAEFANLTLVRDRGMARGVAACFLAIALLPSCGAFTSPGVVRLFAARDSLSVERASARLRVGARGMVAVGDAGSLASIIQQSCEVAGTCLPAAAAAASKIASSGAAAKAASTVGGVVAAKGAAASNGLPDLFKTAESAVASVGIHFPTAAEQAKIMGDISKPLQPVVSSIKTATLPLTKAAASASGQVTGQISALQASAVKMVPPEVLLAEKKLEAVLTPVLLAVAEVIRKVSHDSDKDLFNGYPFNAPALGLWAASVFAFSSIAWKDDAVPYGPGQYSPAKAEEFYGKRWAKLTGRGLQLGFILGGWGIGVLRDKYEFGGRDREKNMPMRAKQLLKICTRLGTTAIKLGQAVSIRTDLLPAPYVKELSKLQDKVEPFPTTMSREILKRELGLEAPGALEAVFAEISPKPVASASIGQVYKAKLMDGQEVAIKVQRPDVIQDIALDLYISRTVLPIYKKIMGLNTNFVGLVDEWGEGFVNELDYVREARNGKRFLRAMESRGLDAVTTAEAIEPLCSGRVLTTKWIDGERLERSTEDDVGRLCGVALNAYLTMLLDTGLLHCDPHPGNLLRTTDGRLAILDWGMTVEVEPDLQYTLLEYIAHLTVEDYAAIPYDLIKLGFVPPGKEDAFTRAGVVEVLSVMLRQLAQGGGPKQVQARLEQELKEEFGDLPRDELRKVLRARMQDMTKRDAESMIQASGGEVNINTVAQKMEELQQNSNVFQIPPWMAYILRTFTVLEGVGLNQDENYSITSECYPFLARRLFTDDSPRAQAALKQMLYGNTPPGGVAPLKLDVERLSDLAKGFQDYTVSTSSVERTAGLENAAGQVTEILLAPGGNFVQQIVIDELATAIDALSRDAFAQVVSSGLGSAAVGVLKQQQQISNSLPGPLRALLTPVLLPGEIALSALPLLAKDEQDEASLATARALLELIQERSGGDASAGGIGGAVSTLGGSLPSDAEGLRKLVGSLTQLRPGISAATARFGAVLLARVADRLEEKLDDPAVSLSELTRQAAEAFVSSVDRVIVELERIADSQVAAHEDAKAQGAKKREAEAVGAK